MMGACTFDYLCTYTQQGFLHFPPFLQKSIVQREQSSLIQNGPKICIFNIYIIIFLGKKELMETVEKILHLVMGRVKIQPRPRCNLSKICLIREPTRRQKRDLIPRARPKKRASIHPYLYVGDWGDTNKLPLFCAKPMILPIRPYRLDTVFSPPPLGYRDNL